jgi:hypothetical protein
LDGFEEFWRVYPRKVGRGAAERAWSRAVRQADGGAETLNMAVTIAVSLEWFNLREQARYCPHPAKWLNEQRWLDHIQSEEPDDASTTSESTGL